jgi:hypothetical protein
MYQWGKDGDKIPYHIEHSGGVYIVKKDSDHQAMGTHKTKAEAQKQMYALLISESGYHKGAK